MANGLMPSDMRGLLNQKYQMLRQQSDTQAQVNRANAYLTNENAAMVRPEAYSRIGLNNANAYKTRQEGDVVKPMTEAEINRINAWIRASDAGVENQNKTTNANAGLINSQAEYQRILNSTAPIEQQQKLFDNEIDLYYKGPRTEAEIANTNAQSGYYRSQTDVNRNSMRGPIILPPPEKSSDSSASGSAPQQTPQPDTSRKPDGQAMLAPMPEPIAGFTPNSALAALFGSRATAAPAPTYRTASYAPTNPALMTPAQAAPVQISMASPDTGAMAPNTGMMAPIVRREVAPSFMDEQGGSSFLRPFRIGSLSSPFSSSLFLKRGTARVPGKGTGDKVPAMLEPGEAVLNKKAAGLIGRDKIAKANAKGNDARAKETMSKLAQSLKMMGMA